MEKPEDRVAKSLRLYGQEFVHGIRRDILFIYRLLHPGVRIAALGTDIGHQFVVLVGDGIMRGDAADAVDPVIDALALDRILRGIVLLIESIYLIEIGL